MLIVALDVAREPFDFAPILILLLLAFVAMVLVVFLLRFLRRAQMIELAASVVADPARRPATVIGTAVAGSIPSRVTDSPRTSSVDSSASGCSSWR